MGREERPIAQSKLFSFPFGNLQDYVRDFTAGPVMPAKGGNHPRASLPCPLDPNIGSSPWGLPSPYLMIGVYSICYR
jgi:hypothetical protein